MMSIVVACAVKQSSAAVSRAASPCRFLSTIIDDLFAFIIKMPTLHRISAFR